MIELSQFLWLLWLVYVAFILQDSPFYSALFYPGQKLTGPARAFKEARWLSGVKPILNSQSHIKATVEEVSAVSNTVTSQLANNLIC